MMGRTAGFNFFENTLLAEIHHRLGRLGLPGGRRRADGRCRHGQRGRGRHVQEGRHRHLRGLQPLPPGNQGGHGRAADLHITADYAGGAGNIAISPAIVVAGATQNVIASARPTAAR
jgi:hypothetical protein